MNWDYLKKAIGFRIELQPEPIRLDENGCELPPRNDEWVISDANATHVHILNITSGHTTTLGKDHVHHFTSNPNRSVKGGLQYGFLTLLVQIYVKGSNVSILPCPRPGERLPPQPVPIVQKWVDLNYPSDCGIVARLQSQGYRVVWCVESLLLRRTEIEGWEMVLEKGKDGVLASFHLRDYPENQVLIKSRSTGH